MPTLREINIRLNGIFQQTDFRSQQIINAASKNLLEVFKKVYADIDKILADLYKRFDVLSPGEMAKYNRLAKLQQEIIATTKGLIPKANGEITKCINKNMHLGYYSQGYAWETSLAADLGFAQVDAATLVGASVNEYGLINWKDSTAQNVAKYRNDVRFAVTQGVMQGHSYSKMSRAVKKKTAVASHGMYRIMRTEGGRALSAGELIGMQKVNRAAQTSSFEVVKFWIATLDQATRPDHGDADGQTRPLDGDFRVGGVTMPAPRMSGDPGQDINCRCTTGTKIGKIKNNLRFDNIRKTLVNNITYGKWLKSKSIKI